MFIRSFDPRKISPRVRSTVNNAKSKRILNSVEPGDYFVSPMPDTPITQWASANLVSKILNQEISAENDPKWQDFGFKTKKDYNFWSWRICGLICVKQVIDALVPDNDESVASLTEKGVCLGGYDTVNDKGWFYLPLIKLAKTYDLDGKVHGSLTINEISASILKNHFIIASVHPGVIRGDLNKNPHDDKGHLVLVVGFQFKNNRINGFYINNPSGRKSSTQQKTFIPIDMFREAFASRGFSLFQNK